MQNEIWKDIPGLPDYQSSNLGRVKVLERTQFVNTAKRQYLRKTKEKVLSQNKDTRGYMHTSILDINRGVHRLVCKAFHGYPKDDKLHANHLNGIKDDNRPENLEWATASENEQHSYRKLNKQVWNKGIKYDTTNAVAVRRKNYIIKCIETYNYKQKFGLTNVKLASIIGLTREAISYRIKKFKEVMPNE